MERYNKRITMFYRGGDNSNKVMSSTKGEFENEKMTKFIDIEYINLDKRNFTKYFDKLESANIIPDIAYIWHDEEILLDFIKEKFPQIEVKIYGSKIAKVVTKGYSDYNKTTYTAIAKGIIEEYKNSMGTIELWKVNRYEIDKVKLSNYDYERMSNVERLKYFNTKKDAIVVITLNYEGDIRENDNNIKYYIEKNKDLKEKYLEFIKSYEEGLNYESD